MKNLILMLLLAPALGLSFELKPIEDIQLLTGETLQAKAEIDDASAVSFYKTYGHDDIKVNAITGVIEWAMPASQPQESYHVGIKASNESGTAHGSFIVHWGAMNIVKIGPSHEKKSFREAFSSRDPHPSGTTFVVESGTYSGYDWVMGQTGGGRVQMPPNGTQKKYTTLMAEKPLNVTTGEKIQFKAGLGRPVEYIAIKGFYTEKKPIGIVGSLCKSTECRPNHIKFIRNCASNGPRGGFYVGNSSHILLENNCSFGGARYKFSFYKTNDSIMRRNVARFDYNTEHIGPKGSFSNYTSLRSSLQNNIVIDSDRKEFSDIGEVAGDFGCPTTAGPSSGNFDKNLQINSDYLRSNFDRQNGADCRADIKNAVSWDVRPRWSLILTRAPSLFTRSTFNHVDLRSPSVLANGWPNKYSRGFKNSIFHDIKNGPLFTGFSVEGERLGVDLVNITGFDGALTLNSSEQKELGRISKHPATGLKYPARVEEGSALFAAGLGANIETFTGKSGTLSGESGYNLETNAPAWPFPFERSISQKMAKLRYTGPRWDWGTGEKMADGALSGARGFAKSGESLTDYVWSYDEHPAPPMGVFADVNGSKLSLVWDYPPESAQKSLKYFEVIAEKDGKKEVLGVATAPRFEANLGSGLYKIEVLAVHEGAKSGSYMPLSVEMKGEIIPPPASFSIEIKAP